MPGVYISYPFCAHKCTYCNFASGVFPRELEPKYLEALRARGKEITIATTDVTSVTPINEKVLIEKLKAL